MNEASGNDATESLAELQEKVAYLEERLDEARSELHAVTKSEGLTRFDEDTALTEIGDLSTDLDAARQRNFRGRDSRHGRANEIACE